MQKHDDVLKNKSELFDHWGKIPIIEVVDDEERYSVAQNPILILVLKILREGIEDGDQMRHALSAKELQEKLSSHNSIDGKISLTNMYHYIDKLVETEYLKHISILNRNNKIRYYYRTAKFYLYTHGIDDLSKFHKLFNSSGAGKVIQHFNPNISHDILEKKFIPLFKAMRDFGKTILQWMEMEHELLHELDIDPLEFYMIMTSMASISKEVRESTTDTEPLLSFLFNNKTN